MVRLYCANINFRNYTGHMHKEGAKGNWDFRISDLVKNPDGTDI